MSGDVPPPLSDEEARRKRVEALSRLAQNQSGTPGIASPLRASGASSPERQRPTSPAPKRTARSRPPWLVMVSVALVILLVAGVVLHQLGVFPGLPTKSQAGPTSVVIAPSLQDLDCLHDAAWSPDGNQIAVIGYRDQCPSDIPNGYTYQAGVLHIYKVATGELVRSILPDATILALPGIPSPPAALQPASANSDTSKPVINYAHLLWSPGVLMGV